MKKIKNFYDIETKIALKEQFTQNDLIDIRKIRKILDEVYLTIHSLEVAKGAQKEVFKNRQHNKEEWKVIASIYEQEQKNYKHLYKMLEQVLTIDTKK